MERADLDIEQKPQPLPREFLLKRGFCCGNVCFNCPYVTEDGEKHVKGTVTVDIEESDVILR